jgi:glycosyltransferase involved in cell wall biosynthesis
MGRRLLSAVMFSPRGGSAHVTRALLRRLIDLGWSTSLVAGSRSDLGGEADARLFYDGIDTRAVDFAPVLATDDPLHPPSELGAVPMHPSFEERQDAPDPVFASLDEAEFQGQVQAWSDELEEAGAAAADVLYIHHLTPMNEAAAGVAHGVPIVGHLHGTELLMMEQIEQGPPAGWEFAQEWRERLRGWAADAERLVVSPAGVERARRLLDLEPEKLVPLANGFDPGAFHPLEIDRLAHWRRHLVEQPTALASDGAGIAYTDADIEILREATVLLYVGRFTEVKRLPFLLEAFASAHGRFERPGALVIVGGHPGEWEGEHPVDAAERLGLEDVFFAGWQRQERLPPFLNVSDAIILPSAREQFGQTLVEGMACGLPGIAANALGPSRILVDGETGWLFEPEDRDGLALALLDAVNDLEERRRRGRLAHEEAIHRLSWPTIAVRLDRVLSEVAGVAAGEAKEAAAETIGDR